MNKENYCKALKLWIYLGIFTIGSVFLLQSGRLQAQDTPQIPKRLYVTFYYDETGNRIDRQIIIAMNTRGGEEDSLRNVREVDGTMESSDARLMDAGNSPGAGDEVVWKDKLGDLSVVLYPNPVYESFNVIAQKTGTTEGRELIEYSLYALSGRLLQRGEIAIDENRMINMEDYTAGVYLFVIECHGFRETWKIIKQ